MITRKNVWIVGVILLLFCAVIWFTKMGGNEGFTTVDLNTAHTQRQMLQMEGEQRYNPMARLQAPTVALDPSRVDAAFNQPIPAATTGSPSLLTLLGFTELGAYASPGDAVGVEQTGAVQSKIDFCESLTTINCGLLASDPLMAECGFCHKDGINSKGRAHRGGMFISADDQIRANEVANGTNGPNGGAATYRPTVGTCDPRNFTLMQDNCEKRELQMGCQKAGAATSSNNCGQCFGSTSANSTGLLFMGPKPRAYTAVLHLSHPGGQGTGTTVTFASGATPLTIPASSQPVLDPQQLTLEITEGDRFTLTIQGMPAVWCGWLSSPDGLRTVSLDVAEQSIQPSAGFTIAGDSRSSTVTSAVSDATWLSSVPNTVLWFQRRDEVVGGMAISAVYGDQQGSAVDVSGAVKSASPGTLVSPDLLQGGGGGGVGTGTNHLWIVMDTGNTVILADGQAIPTSSNQMVMSVTVPATLIDPPFQDDKLDCSTGPIVMTELGASIMGSHSCFTADGSFNPSVFCLQRLFQAAGGSPKGTLYPNTDAAAAALSKGTLDDTMAFLNAQANIAIYGVDETGAPQPFSVVKAASMAMLGITLNNPCDGPTSTTGPHTPECLDYLWRTSGNLQEMAANQDPTALPYSYCSKSGSAAPLNPDGTVNQQAIAAANGQGSTQAVRSYFQGFFNRSQNSSDFDAQAAAMRSCYGSFIQPPPETPSACPLPNPDEWQCFGPQQLQQPEVFVVGPATTLVNATALCGSYGATVATTSQLQDAFNKGADWCLPGWVSDDPNARYPRQTASNDCGGGVGLMTYGADWMPKDEASGDPISSATCYGKKPPQGTDGVAPFNQNQWYATADTNILIGKQVAGQSYCAQEGWQCKSFTDMPTCQSFLATNPTLSPLHIYNVNPVSADIDRYLRNRV